MKKIILAALAALVAGPALAHTGQGDANGFYHGLVHPILGPDHLLAMLAVGLWSGFVIPERFWAGALTFMTAMAAGAGLSWAGFATGLAEPMILASVVLFGALVLVARHGQPASLTLASLAAIAVFAAAHGYAHAAEAVGAVSAYLAGFLVATAALHLLGIGIARAVCATGRGGMAQAAFGTAIAASGLWLMAG